MEKMKKSFLSLSRKFLISPARDLCKKVILFKRQKAKAASLTKDNHHEVKVEMQPEIFPEWIELTPECLIDIFSRLSMEQRWTGPMLVCKTWMNTCQEQSLNSVFDLETSFVSCSNASNWWSPEFGERVDTILRLVVDRSQSGLKEIRIRHCTNESILYVAERCPNLEVLWVKYWPKVTDNSMRNIALKCPKLKELDISCSYGISCECMGILGMNCKNLQIFKNNLMNPSKAARLVNTRFVPSNYLAEPSTMTLGNLDARTIREHMQQLRHLELRFSTLNDRGLASICEACSDLEYLDLFGCRNLTSVNVTNIISSLKNLKLCDFVEFI